MNTHKLLVEDQLKKIQTNSLPLKMTDSAKIVIHAIPTSFRTKIDLKAEVEKDNSMLRRLYLDTEKGSNYKYAGLMMLGEDFLSYGIRDETNPSQNLSSINFTIFENAVFEYVNAWIFRDYGSRKKYPHINYGKLMPMNELFNLIYSQILWMLTHYQRLEINDEFLFNISIDGVKYHSLVTDIKDPILEANVEDIRQKFDENNYHFNNIKFNHNPLSLGSQSDFDRTFTQMRGDIDPALKSFWKLKAVTYSDWVENNIFTFGLNDYLRVLRS